MTTKLPNPHYLPDVCIKVTLINFGITSLGLEEQLLADVVKQERPDLSEKRGQLTVSIASDQKKVLDMEDRVLTMLSESTCFWNVVFYHENIGSIHMSILRSFSSYSFFFFLFFFLSSFFFLLFFFHTTQQVLVIF